MSETPRIDVVNFVAGINPKSIAELVNVTGQARNAGSTRIILNISSTGGNLPVSFPAYYHLRSLGLPLEAHNMGNVESAAMLLFLSADIRKAFPYNRFMLHPFNWGLGGDVLKPVLFDCISSLDFDAKRYSDIFKERTQGAQSPIDVDECLLGKQLIVGPGEAKGARITTVDSPPSEPTVPAGAILWWISAGSV